MARVVLPLLGVTAHGTIGKSVTYRDHIYGPTVARYKKHRDFQSAAQLAQRAWFRAAATAWQALSGVDKAAWRVWAEARVGMLGYNLFVSEFTVAVAYQIGLGKVGRDYVGG